MTKPIVAGTFLATVFLTVAAYVYPIYPASWLASTSTEFAILRTILAAILLGLLFTKPPRKMYFRLILGVAAAATFLIAVAFMFQFKLALLDFLMLGLASTNFALAAIEPNPAREKWQEQVRQTKLKHLTR